jgi:hypothetical protein
MTVPQLDHYHYLYVLSDSLFIYHPAIQDTGAGYKKYKNFGIEEVPQTPITRQHHGKIRVLLESLLPPHVQHSGAAGSSIAQVVLCGAIQRIIPKPV